MCVSGKYGGTTGWRWLPVWGLMWLCCHVVMAQENEVWSREDGWEEYVEQMAELMGHGEEDSEWDDELLEELYEVFCHPLNLNDLNADELRNLPWLTEVQVLDVLDYVDRHRPLLSVGELMAVRSLDYRSRRLLQLFCVAGEMKAERKSVWERLARSRQELVARTDVPLYTKMGFANYPAEVLEEYPNRVYRGNRLYHGLRYAMRMDRQLEAGFQLEKDVGERGVDYWSGYGVLHGLGRLRTLAVGDYRVGWGQGLVVNTSTALGKLMMLSRVGRLDQGIRRHSSMMESNYLRGLAATVDVGRSWQLAGYASLRNVDGTLANEGRAVSTLKTDGLHRTQNERMKRGNLERSDVGMHVAWAKGVWQVSASAAYTHFSLPLHPVFTTAATRYRKYNAAGSDFGAYGLAYGWNESRVKVTGESALSSTGGWATLNTLQAEVWGTKLTLLQRYYSARYVAMNGKAFGENRQTQNEGGVFAALQRNVSRRLTVNGFVDWMYFPWKKYQVSNRSQGFDVMVQMQWEKSERTSLNLRYRTKSKQKDWPSTGAGSMAWNTTHNLRLQHVWRTGGPWSLKTSLLGSMAHFGTDTHLGMALSETASVQPTTSVGKQNRVKGSVTLTYFNTDGYSARLFLYEPSLLYTFGIGSFYDHGLRTALLCHVPLLKGRLTLIGKVGSTHYFNRQTIGTGLDQILHNHREDLQLQVKWKYR